MIKNKIIISLGTQYKEKNLSMNKHKIQIFFKDKKNNIIKKNNEFKIKDLPSKHTKSFLALGKVMVFMVN